MLRCPFGLYVERIRGSISTLLFGKVEKGVMLLKYSAQYFIEHLKLAEHPEGAITFHRFVHRTI